MVTSTTTIITTTLHYTLNRLLIPAPKVFLSQRTSGVSLALEISDLVCIVKKILV